MTQPLITGTSSLEEINAQQEEQKRLQGIAYNRFRVLNEQTAAASQPESTKYDGHDFGDCDQSFRPK